MMPLTDPAMKRIPPSIEPIPAPPAVEPLSAEPLRPGVAGVHWMRWLLLLLVLPVLISHALVVLLRWAPPPTTAFMLQSPTQPVQYQWVPADRIAEIARKAVVAAEDQKFWAHNGFDFEAIEKALEHNEKSRRKRGASTISQQVTKNLFLWPGRSWLRKGLEVYGTALIEFIWGKERILEVYLNIAEFGPGVYGVEAAAQKFFHKPASKLSPEEAARLAAVLPNPRRWKAAAPGPYVQARSNWILGQMGYRRAIPEEPEPPPELAPSDLDEPAPATDGTGDMSTEPAVEPQPEVKAYPGETPPGKFTASPDPEAVPPAEPGEPQPLVEEPPSQEP